MARKKEGAGITLGQIVGAEQGVAGRHKVVGIVGTFQDPNGEPGQKLVLVRVEPCREWPSNFRRRSFARVDSCEE